MHNALRRSMFALVFALLPVCLTADAADSSKAKLNEQRLLLSEGYSLLYADATNLKRAKLILYVKVESDDLDKIVTAIATFGGELKNNLERIAKDYPGVRIDLDPLPEMEKRKRTAIGMDLARYFTPVIGHSGREYERRVLLGFYNGLNHERHLCEVMAKEEPDANLKKFLLDTEKRYSAFYDRVVALLEKEYFKK